MAIQLLIVDDEWLDREGLRDQVLRVGVLPDVVVHTAKSGAEALRLMELQRIDILMADIRMPQMTGLALAEQALRQLPLLCTVFVSGYDDFAYAQRAIQIRAAWYLLKPVQDEELVKALRRCVSILEQTRPAALAQETPPPIKSHEEKLCDRIDSYINAHLAQPVTLIGIAREMHYTPNYLGRVFQETRGVGFSVHLQKMRMRAAEKLLREQPTLRVREVARLVGYTNAEAFSRAFYQEYGVSPLVFRNTCQV